MYSTYVALGDSSTEGLDDPDGNGGYRGWADRLAGQVAATSPGLRYANLAVRGRLAGQVRAEQVGPALALAPDLVTVFAGVNDLLRPAYDPTVVLGELEQMLATLRASGSTVLTLTCADPGPVMPLARVVRGRVIVFNQGLREAAARTGTVLADVAAHPVASDPRLWSEDRLHANTLGHERIAAALAQALGLPGSSADWTAALPVAARRPAHQVARAEAAWARTHLTPWVLRRLRGRSSGDGMVAKRPELLPYA